MGCRASRILCKQKTLSMSHEAPRRHDRARGEGGPGPGAAAKAAPPRSPPPLPWNPREPGVAVGLAGREAAELTPLGIKNLNSFLYFFRVEESRGWFDSWVGKICWRRDRLPTQVFLGFPCGSAGKESACNVGYLGLECPLEKRNILAWRIPWTI